MYDIASKFAKNSPLPCWVGYERVPGTAKGAKGSCRKSSPAKEYVSDAQRKAVWASKADGGKGNPNKMLSSPAKKQKGGGIQISGTDEEAMSGAAAAGNDWTKNLKPEDASKDSSKVNIYNSLFKDNKIQLSTYKKNWRYGESGSIEMKISKISSKKDNLIIGDKNGSIKILSSDISGKLKKKGNVTYVN